MSLAASQERPRRAQIRAIRGSLGRPVANSFRRVERGWLSKECYREFVFEQAARRHTTLNPGFFTGTVIEAALGAAPAP